MLRYINVPERLFGQTWFDWIEAFAVPLVIAVITGVFLLVAQRAARRADRQWELAEENAQAENVRDYLDRISDLVLNHDLLNSSVNSPVRAIATARTQATLRALNGPRKGVVIRFLYESRLIVGSEPVISLSLADLTGASLDYADLRLCNFDGANLRDADLHESDLRFARFVGAVVSSAQLSQASYLAGAIGTDGTEITPID